MEPGANIPFIQQSQRTLNIYIVYDTHDLMFVYTKLWTDVTYRPGYVVKQDHPISIIIWFAGPWFGYVCTI